MVSKESDTVYRPTFFGLSRRLSAGWPVLFGVPSALGTPYAGTCNGPYFLRRLTQRFTRACADSSVIDLRQGVGLIKCAADAGDVKPGESLSALVADIETVVSKLPAGCAPIAIGGDHSITLPIVRALQTRLGRPITVVCFDHHLDHQFWSRSLDPLFHTNVMSHVSEIIGAGRLIQIGSEPVQSAPSALVEWYASRLAKVGRQIALLTPEIEDDAAVLSAVGCGGDVYISVDVDVLPRHQMRATAYPADIGLPLERVVALIKLISEHNHIVGADLVEFAANRDDRTPEILADGARAAILLYELLRVVIDCKRSKTLEPRGRHA